MELCNKYLALVTLSMLGYVGRRASSLKLELKLAIRGGPCAVFRSSIIAANEKNRSAMKM